MNRTKRAFDEQRLENAGLKGENRKLFESLRAKNTTSSPLSLSSKNATQLNLSTSSSPASASGLRSFHPYGSALSATASGQGLGTYTLPNVAPRNSSAAVREAASFLNKFKQQLNHSVATHIEASNANSNFNSSTAGGWNSGARDKAPSANSFRDLVGSKYLIH